MLTIPELAQRLVYNLPIVFVLACISDYSSFLVKVEPILNLANFFSKVLWISRSFQWLLLYSIYTVEYNQTLPTEEIIRLLIYAVILILIEIYLSRDKLPPNLEALISIIAGNTTSLIAIVAIINMGSWILNIMI